MRLWRLSAAQHARSFDGGYGRLFDGRWNTIGRAITYCATCPSLCILEKLVHVEDPMLLPPLMMVAYEIPGEVAVDRLFLKDLPTDWRRRQIVTQQLGDEWCAGLSAALLGVPSALVPFADTQDQNVIINHAHRDATRITISSIQPFDFDPRLLAP